MEQYVNMWQFKYKEKLCYLLIKFANFPLYLTCQLYSYCNLFNLVLQYDLQYIFFFKAFNYLNLLTSNFTMRFRFAMFSDYRRWNIVHMKSKHGTCCKRYKCLAYAIIFWKKSKVINWDISKDTQYTNLSILAKQIKKNKSIIPSNEIMKKSISRT